MGQTDNFDPRARTVRSVQTFHHLGHTLTGNPVALDDKPVGSLIGDHRDTTFLSLAPATTGLWRKRLEHFHQITRKSMLELDHLNIFRFSVIQAGDNGFHPADVVQMITDNQRIGGANGGKMTILRHQRTQHRHQLFHRGILHRNDPGHQLLAGALPLVYQRQIALLGRRVGDDFNNIACWNGSVTVYLQHRQEQLIHFIRR